MNLTEQDYQVLSDVVTTLESTDLTVKISQIVGMPIEKAMAALPGHWSNIVARATKTALEKAFDGALMTLKQRKPTPPHIKTHKLLAGVSGAVGGAMGVTTLALELPVSATIMLRSIAEIARSHGEDLDKIEAKLACLEVFALGSTTAAKGGGAETGYYAVRSFLAKSVGDTARYITAKGLAKDGAPALVRFIDVIASRFSITVSEKFAAQSVPVIGAVGGASLNLLFIAHFQRTAHAHFTVRALERRYGQEMVEQVYSTIANKGRN